MSEVVKKQRNSNFELLRIIAMFFICTFHYIFHGTWNMNIWQRGIHAQLIFTAFILLMGKVAVMLFVFVGAYFLCEKSYASRRPLYLILMSWMYASGIFLLLKIVHSNTVQGITIKDAFWPVGVPSGYWFVSAYIMMLFLMPALNTVVNNVSRKRLGQLIILGVVISLLCGTLLQIYPKTDFFTGTFGTVQLGAFIIEYFTGAYVRKYGINYSLLRTVLLSVILWCGMFIVFNVTTKGDSLEYAHLLIWLDTDMSPLVWLVAVDIFVLFNFIHIPQSKVINCFASSMLGVYLISDNTFIRSLLWGFVNDTQYHGIALIGNCLFSAFIVFGGCALIDWALGLVYRPVLRFISNKMGKYIDNKLR